MMKNVFVLQQL